MTGQPTATALAITQRRGDDSRSLHFTTDDWTNHDIEGARP
jgi:hypothetical protein